MSLGSNSSQSNSSPCESILEGQILATVSSHEIQETPEGEKVTMFRIQVKLGSKAWSVHRRYREFDHLYTQIKKQEPDFNSKFPSKRFLNNFSTENINKRKKGLDDFIKAAVASPSVVKMPILSHFLKITPEHLSYLESEPNFRSSIGGSGGGGGGSSHETDRMQADTQALRPPVFARQVSNQVPSDASNENEINLGNTNNPVAKPNDFEFLNVVGKGSFGKVYMAMHKFEKKVYAVKILKKEAIIKRNEVKHIMAERNVLIRNLSHPFLVGLHYSFQSADKLYFVLDYVNGGELFYHLLQNRVFPEPRVKFYAAEIAHAIGYMHSMNIIYRDLKPENILIDSEGHIKLTDFGLCKEGIQANTKTSTFCGTPEYLAPEILQKQPYTRAIDWWCLGCVIYEMLLGLPPFYCKDVNEMYSRILHAPLRWASHYNVTISNAIKSLLIGLLQKNVADRLGANEADFDELRNHEFFVDIDWNALVEKRIPVPWIPNVNSNTDLQHIDPEFTRESIPESLGKSLLANRDREVEFRGFTYAPDSNLF